MKNDVVSSVRFTAEQDSIRYDASPPNSSELEEEFICYDSSPTNSSELEREFIWYDANQDSYITFNPESQCSLCANKDLARNPESQCSLCPNVYGKNSSHSIVAKCALSTEDSFEQGKILANTRSILLLLNDADNIKCSRSNVKYVTQVKKHFITILINFLAEDTCVDLFGFIDLGNGICNFFEICYEYSVETCYSWSVQTSYYAFWSVLGNLKDYSVETCYSWSVQTSYYNL